MVDLSQLSAAEFAAQVARPSGEVGIAVGEYMNRVNARLIEAAFRLLAPPANARVLEIGFGNGVTIGRLLAMAPGLAYAGVEVSETMLAAAREHNRAALEAGRVALHRASVERLPFADAAFDRALAVNTIYFWPDQLAGLKELRRVLRADGLLVVASITPEIIAQSTTMKPELGFRIPDREALLALHRDAGFRRVDCGLYEEEATRLDGTAYLRTYHMVAAQA
jgi:SAM-dependent methyltransferase